MNDWLQFLILRPALSTTSNEVKFNLDRAEIEVVTRLDEALYGTIWAADNLEGGAVLGFERCQVLPRRCQERGRGVAE
jgi:hypothetical protein